MTSTSRILVTGAGGIAGVNFVRSLRVDPKEFFIIGTDFNKYYLEFPDVDMKITSPRHSDPSFLDLVKKTVSENKIQFVHPQPSSEAEVIAANRDSITAVTLLPPTEVISRDKLQTLQILQSVGIPGPKTHSIDSMENFDTAYETIGSDRVWVRSKKGAGGNLSLSCGNVDEAKKWIQLWISNGRAKLDDFIFHEYLPGRNLAWDSLWYKGKFISAFARERLDYPLKHVAPSKITGTPSVSRIIIDENVNKIGKGAIRALDPKPHGSYALDLKEDAEGVPKVTEVDAGKFHSTTPLWGYISTKILHQDPLKNIPYSYLRAGLDGTAPESQGDDIYPAGMYLLRNIDSGVWLWYEDGSKVRVV